MTSTICRIGTWYVINIKVGTYFYINAKDPIMIDLEVAELSPNML